MKALLFALCRWVLHERLFVGLALLNALILAGGVAISLGLGEYAIRYADDYHKAGEVEVSRHSSPPSEPVHGWVFGMERCRVEAGARSFMASCLVPIPQLSLPFPPRWGQEFWPGPKGIAASGDMEIFLGRRPVPGESVEIRFGDPDKAMATQVDRIGPWISLSLVDPPIVILWPGLVPDGTSYTAYIHWLDSETGVPPKTIGVVQSFRTLLRFLGFFYVWAYGAAALLNTLLSVMFTHRLASLFLGQVHMLRSHGMRIVHARLAMAVMAVLYLLLSVGLGAALYRLILLIIWGAFPVLAWYPYLLLAGMIGLLAVPMAALLPERGGRKGTAARKV